MEVADLQRRVQDLKVLLTDNQQWLNEKASKLVSPVSVPASHLFASRGICGTQIHVTANFRK